MKLASICVGMFLVGSLAFAELTEVNLTPACKNTLETQALNKETAHLSAAGEVLASKLEARATLSYWPEAKDVAVGVMVEDPADGRYVRYRAKVLKTELAACQIQLERQAHTACRYSRAGGPDSLTEIPGFQYQEGRTIRAQDPMSSLEIDQVHRALSDDNAAPIEAEVRQMIQDTDDGEVTTGTVILPSGSRLTYVGAYGGDNPYGTFFKEGTVQVAGSDSDSDICIVP
ncbi:MAG: hypothetical protein AB7F86_19750 [Bdellovibrionales bacterium]